MSLIIIKKYLTNDSKISYTCELENTDGIGNKITKFTNKKDIEMIRKICESPVQALLYREHSNDFVRQLCVTRLEQRIPVELYNDNKIYRSYDDISYNFKNIEPRHAMEIKNAIVYSI